MQETWVQSWVRKIPWRRKWQPIPVLLPGKSHGQRNLIGYSPWVTKSQTRLNDFTFIFQDIIRSPSMVRSCVVQLRQTAFALRFSHSCVDLAYFNYVKMLGLFLYLNKTVSFKFSLQNYFKYEISICICLAYVQRSNL